MKRNKRKYDKFKIKIVYHDGDVEEVKYRSNVNTSDYNEMLKVYKDTKAKFLNDEDVAVIDFIGVSAKGEIGLIFTKEVSKYIGKDISNNLDMDCREVTGNAILWLSVLKEQKHYYQEICEETQKRKDTLLHKVLLLDNCDPEDKASLEHSLILELKENETRRRIAKNNLNDLIAIHKKININSAIGRLKDYSDKRDLKGFDKEEPEHFGNRVEKKVAYKDERERARLIRKYRFKYDKMKNDVVTKTLYFYNHVGLQKYKKLPKYKLHRVHKKH